MAVGTGLLLPDDAPSANAKLVKSEKKKNILKKNYNHLQKLMKSEKEEKKTYLGNAIKDDQKISEDHFVKCT